MRKFVKEKKATIIVVILMLILIVGVPFIINTLFKIHPSNEFFIAEWNAGDLLIYCGSILLGIVTIYLSYVAITQTKYANKMNERLLRIEESDKKAFLKLNVANSKVKLVDDDKKNLSLEFENITDNLIVKIEINGSDKILTETCWKKDVKSEGGEGVIVTSVNFVGRDMLKQKDNKVTFDVQVDNLSWVMILSFKVTMKSIYGFDTIQYFNIYLIDNNIVNYETLT